MGPDRRRLHHRRPEAAQHDAEKRDIKRGASRRGDSLPSSRRRPTPADGEVVEGQTGRRRFAAHRPGGARLRLQEPCRHRSSSRPDPHLTVRRGPSRRAQLPALISKANTGSDVWGDTAYRSRATRAPPRTATLQITAKAARKPCNTPPNQQPPQHVSTQSQPHTLQAQIGPTKTKRLLRRQAHSSICV